MVDCSSDPLGWNLPSLSVRPSEARNPQVIKCTDIRNLDNILASVQQAIILSKSQQGGGVSLVIDSLSGIIQRHGKTAVCRFLAGLTKLCKYNEDRIKKDKCDSEDGGVVVALLHGDLHLGSDGMFRVNAVEYMANIIVRLVFSPSSVSQVETFEESSSTSPERDFTCYITNKKASGRVTRVVQSVGVNREGSLVFRRATKENFRDGLVGPFAPATVLPQDTGRPKVFIHTFSKMLLLDTNSGRGGGAAGCPLAIHPRPHFFCGFSFGG